MENNQPKTVIACFSGTGNSWYVAKKLASALEDAQVLLIPDIMENPDILGTPEQLGIVFPVYMLAPPVMVMRFIQEVIGNRDMQGLEYLFMVATCGAGPGWSLSVAERLCMFSGVMTSYAAKIKMPDGYVFLAPVPEEHKIAALYQKADASIQRIAEDIAQGNLHIARKKPFTKLYMRLFLGMNKHLVAEVSTRYVVTDACTGCNICYQGCPANNIIMENGKPQFGAVCEGCMGCYHRCPAHAINFVKKPRRGYTWYPNQRSGFRPEYRK